MLRKWELPELPKGNLPRAMVMSVTELPCPWLPWQPFLVLPSGGRLFVAGTQWAASSCDRRAARSQGASRQGSKGPELGTDKPERRQCQQEDQGGLSAVLSPVGMGLVLLPRPALTPPWPPVLPEGRTFPATPGLFL